MYVVALTRLESTVDAAAQRLATALGMTAYDVRLSLVAGLPAILTITADKQRALEVLSAARQLGHSALACDLEAVVAHEDMIAMRRFRFEPFGLYCEVPGGEAHLPYADILCGLRAVHKHSTETTVAKTEKTFALGRTIVSGGLMTRKKTVREVTTTDDEREEVFYLYRRSGQTPWLLTEGHTHYNALGPHMAPTQRENFLKTIELIKAACPDARFDDRLLTAKKIPENVSRGATSKSRESSSADGVDLLAHLLAFAISREPVDAGR